jgi:hypothetical protein
MYETFEFQSIPFLFDAEHTDANTVATHPNAAAPGMPYGQTINWLVLFGLLVGLHGPAVARAQADCETYDNAQSSAPSRRALSPNSSMQCCMTSARI